MVMRTWESRWECRTSGSESSALPQELSDMRPFFRLGGGYLSSGCLSGGLLPQKIGRASAPPPHTSNLVLKGSSSRHLIIHHASHHEGSSSSSPPSMRNNQHDPPSERSLQHSLVTRRKDRARNREMVGAQVQAHSPEMVTATAHREFQRTYTMNHGEPPSAQLLISSPKDLPGSNHVDRLVR
ncbi:hypothetical protein Tco_1209775 [Tanacetum coccineum]